MGAARPNALALPSPTSSQFAVFIAALLTAGAFVGTWVHNAAVGGDWYREVTRCYAPSVSGAGGAFAAQVASDRAAQRCSAYAERRLAALELAGVGTVALLGVALLAVAPGVLERRRRLRAPGERLAPAAERLDELAGEARLSRPPALMLGAATQRDAFSYGLPGRYRIALPPAAAVRWRDASLFDPLVRHELAHVRHRDVALAWLARSSWYAVAALLAVPAIGGLVAGDASLLPSYLWRAALLGLTVQLVSAALLRSRELVADLWAAQAAGDEATVAGLLERLRGAPAPSVWRRPFARHPSPAERLDVLARPERAAAVGFGDGFAPAFLAGLSLPLIAGIVGTLLTGNSQSTTWATVVAVCLTGPLIAGSVGLGLARAALLGRVAGTAVAPVLPAAGVAAGLVAGQVASLANTGIGGGLAEIAPVPWIAAMVLLGFGGTLLAAGLGELWADAAPALPGPRAAWVGLVAVQTLLFAAVLWLATTLETPIRAGWPLLRAWLVAGAQNTIVLVAVAVTALAAGWALLAARRAAVTPGWLLERGEPEPWPAGRGGVREPLACALAAGLAAGGGAVLFRIAEGRAATDEEALQRFYLVVWLAALAAAAAAAVLMLRHERRGAGAALLAGPAAGVVTVLVFLAENTVLGGGLSYGFVKSVLLPPLALGLIGVACVAPLSLLSRPLAAPAWRAAVAGAAVVSALVIVQRDGVLPPTSTEALAAAALDRTRSALSGEIDTPRNYVALAGAQIFSRYHAIVSVAPRVQVQAAGGDAELRAKVLTPLRRLLADARAVRPPAGAAAVHASCVGMVETAVTQFSALAVAARAAATGDVATFTPAVQRTNAARGRAVQLQAACGDGLVRLSRGG